MSRLGTTSGSYAFRDRPYGRGYGADALLEPAEKSAGAALDTAKPSDQPG